MRQAVLAAALALAGAGAFAQGVAPERASPVKDPYWGAALFDFYQDHYFSAITGLMASQQFNRVSHHDVEAEMLRGGLLLSYGMHLEAGRIFEALIDKGLAPDARNRAWFFLAKIRYQRGLPGQAEEAIARIQGKLPPALEEDKVLLHAQLLLARGDNAGAADVLKTLPKDSPGMPYARFNLGVAFVKGGDFKSGSKVLDELGRMPAANEEIRNLRDKANVALGFAELGLDHPSEARNALQRVRLEGLLSNKALLGFGWAAAADKEPRKALVPWAELATRDLSDAAVLEARIAVPYALAEVGALVAALDGYRKAIDDFAQENVRLDDSIAAIRAGKLFEVPAGSVSADQMGWMREIERVPAMPHPGHLNQLFAQHEMQEALKNLRDLQFLSGNLEDWARNLGIFNHMLALRSQAYAQRLPQVRASAGMLGQQGLVAAQRRRDALAAELSSAEQSADGLAFASPAQRALLERIAKMGEALRTLGAGADATAARERTRLAAGAMTWQLAKDYSARSWDAKKALNATDVALAEARARDAALAKAQIDEPVRMKQFGERIDELEQRIRALQPQVVALTAAQRVQLQEIAVAELVRQKERLASYDTQARFAVAQMVDRAKSAAEGGAANAPR
jgi:hypothetical protein